LGNIDIPDPGVTKILAGTNVTVSPSTGTGNVTVGTNFTIDTLANGGI